MFVLLIWRETFHQHLLLKQKIDEAGNFSNSPSSYRKGMEQILLLPSTSSARKKMETVFPHTSSARKAMEAVFLLQHKQAQSPSPERHKAAAPSIGAFYHRVKSAGLGRPP